MSRNTLVPLWHSCHNVFFFNDTATTEIYTLSLHDALPIYVLSGLRTYSCSSQRRDPPRLSERPSNLPTRSEEHTSELQSQSNLVCRLLLEKKKHTNNITFFFRTP